ncbi:MAG: twin-arginine translocation signal domain-containing protein, partial [Chloroflexi bacterium]|nr:twin-arginine translocation signal domain-containing protein [Chloroflexota bacterium]
MDRRQANVSLTRREFLKRAGLAASGLVASSLACGRTAQEAPPPQPTPTT